MKDLQVWTRDKGSHYDNSDNFNDEVSLSDVQRKYKNKDLINRVGMVNASDTEHEYSVIREGLNFVQDSASTIEEPTC